MKRGSSGKRTFTGRDTLGHGGLARQPVNESLGLCSGGSRCLSADLVDSLIRRR